MITIEQSLNLDVPSTSAYAQWSQFAKFPEFVPGVEKVTQPDEHTVIWSTTFDDHNQDWKLQIDEQIPGKRIAWHGVVGPKHGGVVTFHRLSDEQSRLMLQMDVVVEELAAESSNLVAELKQRIQESLQNFRRYLQEDLKGKPTGTSTTTIPSKDDSAATQ